MQALRVGIVGLGWWSDVLATAFKGSPILELVACYSRSPDKVSAFAQKFNCTPARSYDEMLARPDLEGVIITTPNSQHRIGAEAAARSRKHVFLEKPIAATREDARAIIAACRRAGVVLAVGHGYRRHAGIRRLHSLLEADTLGKVGLAQCIFSKDHGLRLRAEDWRSSPEEVPGGSLMQIGIHHIDNLLYLLGPVVEVSGMFAHVATAGAISDVAAVLLRFANGALGQVAADYVSADRFALTLYGTTALATFDLVEGLSVAYRSAPRAERIDVPANDFLREELEEFAISVRTGRAPEVDGNAALLPLEVVLAALSSAETGRTVKLMQNADMQVGGAHARRF